MKASLGSLASALVLAACASAPTPSPAPAPAPAAAAAAAPPAAPPAWQQGRGSDMAASTLAPLAGRNTATPPGEIALDRLRLPPGFRIELWAHGLPGARAMARGDQGKLYVGTRGIGRVYEVTDRGSERSVRVAASGLNQPAGVAFRGGSLYVMAIDKVLRYDGIESNPAAAPVDLTAAFQLPPLQHHNWKYIRFGPDGKLYVPFGAPCNICEPTAAYAQIRRYNADGSGMEVIARGVRNSVGFDWHPVTGELWFTDHGRDWMGDDTPQDELNRLSRPGLNFGFPYCHADGVPDRDLRKAGACDGVTRPVAEMGPHAAAMGVLFYTGSMFPAEYRNQLLVARKGSWNRSRKSGFDVVRVTAEADGRNARTQPFLTGFLDEGAQTFSGRPAYLLQQPDGSVLVSDEQMGAIYRISYAR
ncbi:PQQ-dependent sugar dehydrogenase [Piscinibacter sakaiensis]|uniref:Glucose/sorbosone dehydrogenases n=1 Tax=Piscinibacter sakaiensis TaxID=1547922 RepID=A0A0K8NWM0_PISS1|nr:PQQ-dependent sugar dehydrogenase [Piscinibacter sakaiensis]GAP34340.1 glucose/sorbosone dehydrogenases [Piscinibacter sakaiensis]